MAGAEFEIHGLRELGRKLSHMEAELSGAALEDAAMDGAEVIRQEMSDRAPVRKAGTKAPGYAPNRAPGHLKRNIMKEVKSKKRDRVVVDVGPRKSAFYGIILEIGTLHFAAAPFMRPAADAKKHDAERAVAANLSRKVMEAAHGA